MKETDENNLLSQSEGLYQNEGAFGFDPYERELKNRNGARNSILDPDYGMHDYSYDFSLPYGSQESQGVGERRNLYDPLSETLPFSSEPFSGFSSSAFPSSGLSSSFFASPDAYLSSGPFAQRDASIPYESRRNGYPYSSPLFESNYREPSFTFAGMDGISDFATQPFSQRDLSSVSSPEWQSLHPLYDTSYQGSHSLSRSDSHNIGGNRSDAHNIGGNRSDTHHINGNRSDTHHISGNRSDAHHINGNRSDAHHISGKLNVNAAEFVMKKKEEPPPPPPVKEEKEEKEEVKGEVKEVPAVEVVHEEIASTTVAEPEEPKNEEPKKNEAPPKKEKKKQPSQKRGKTLKTETPAKVERKHPHAEAKPNKRKEGGKKGRREARQPLDEVTPPTQIVPQSPRPRARSSLSLALASFFGRIRYYLLSRLRPMCRFHI